MKPDGRVVEKQRLYVGGLANSHDMMGGWQQAGNVPQDFARESLNVPGTREVERNWS